ncbi:MAG: hypothetical protein U9R19_13910, partial [Bacteroidota bacterium]|nr:hypothetical protein [Bacteroidota bacterium]
MFDSAITYFTKAKNFAEKYNHDSISANAKIQLGTIYDMLGYSDSAGYYYEQAIGYFNTHADTLGIVKSYLHLSSSLIEYAYYDKALLYGLKSMQLAKQQSNKHYYFLTLLNTGNVYEILKEYDKAI